MRNLSPQEMFKRMAAKHTPKYSFAALENKDFDAWKDEAYPEVMKCLGDYPETCDPNPELIAEWHEDGLVKQRWIIDVQPEISAAFILARPEKISSDDSLPGILCCHGHGRFGKEPVMGNRAMPDYISDINAMNYDYGHQMAKEGFATFAIDWIGFGERNDGNKPVYNMLGNGRDWCNIYYLHATMLGMTSLSINVAHGKAAISFASSLSFIDENRVGVMGLSGGGTMATWMGLCDDRVKATEIICYSDMWEEFGIRQVNYCGMQVAPGLYKKVNLPDLQGLIAPNPLLIDIGINDTCFIVDSSTKCFSQLEKIYEAADARDKLHLDMHNGPHAWGGNEAPGFFKKYL
jgi:hypothetical protein